MNVVVLSPEELAALLERAAERGAEKAFAKLYPEITIGEVAQMLGVSTRTVRRMELRGELPPRFGRMW